MTNGKIFFLYSNQLNTIEQRTPIEPFSDNGESVKNISST